VQNDEEPLLGFLVRLWPMRAYLIRPCVLMTAPSRKIRLERNFLCIAVFYRGTRWAQTVCVILPNPPGVLAGQETRPTVHGRGAARQSGHCGVFSLDDGTTANARDRST
jgi:hypothetical protein